MKKENVEIFDESSIVTLYDDDDQPVEFYEVACVELDGKFYGLMQPVEPMEGLGEDEAIIFEIQRGESEEEDDLFLPIADENLLDRVFGEYVEAVSNEEGGCGCCDCEDCEDCDDDCDCSDGECSCHHHEK